MSFLFQAIRSNQDIQISYTSMHSGESDPQWIGPSRFHFDGTSIYLRGWSYKREAYRDYLPVRIAKAFGIPARRRVDPLPVDVEWNSKVRLWIRPRSDLTEAQARVVRQEYGFGDTSHLQIETRKALEFYVIKHWGLGEAHARLELEKIEELGV
jgi:predicted DNA-binding transcriptional regulator YafY